MAESILKAMMRYSVLLLAVISLFGTDSSASAQSNQQGMDGKTRDLLIQKLAHVYSTLAPSDAARTAITLRLADLHAERARQGAMEELQSGCSTCVAGKEDRSKALRYYQEVLPKLSDSQTAKVLPQVGHLYQLTGQDKLAIETYNKVISSGKQPEAMAEAHLSLAEMAFKKRDYSTARAHYQKVIEIPQSASKGLSSYRIAWCDFNLGQLNPAIQGLVKILSTPELSSRTTPGGVVQVDRAFQEEVSRDLATFIARRSVTPDDAKMLYDLSPETVKLPNVIYLAGETERLGQLKSSIQLWRFSLERQTKPRAKVEGHIRVAQLEMESKNPRAAAQDFDLAMNLWPSIQASGPSAGSDDQLTEMKARLRKLVLDWNRAEKKAPSDELVGSYRTYIKIFPAEADMTVWFAQVLRERKEYAEAIRFYQKGAEISAPGEARENALLGAIETAELSKNQELLVSAYDSYLKMSADKKREIEVLYQKANITYSKNDYAAAAEQMRTIAFMTNAKSPDAIKVRRQAADLALDSLVLLNKEAKTSSGSADARAGGVADARIELWAKDFARLFPMDAPEYAKIARQSVLTQSAGESSPETAWTVLSRFDLASATAADKQAYFKNRLILAEKTGRFSEARDSADQLLKTPGLSVEDQQFALSRKAWLSELIFDFDAALVATEKIQPTKEVPEEQRLLKLAMYADLAQKDTKPYLDRYLGVSKDEDRQMTIASQLVRESKDPVKELDRQKATLLKKPEVYARHVLEIVAGMKSGGVAFAKQALARKEIPATSAGRLLTRVVVLDDIGAQKAKFATHKIDGSNQKKLASTLKARVAMIEALEKTAGVAVESGDWTAQLLSLDLLSKESERFYSEILSLPVPAGLSPEDEQQYLSLLSQQAAPYQVKAQDVKKKVDEFWGNKAAVQSLETSLVESTGALRSMVVHEVELLASVAPADTKASLENLAKRPEAQTALKPNLAEIEKARQAVREAPMNRAKLESLLGLERQAGRLGMVSYLEGRLQTLDKPAPEKSAVKK